MNTDNQTQSTVSKPGTLDIHLTVQLRQYDDGGYVVVAKDHPFLDVLCEGNYEECIEFINKRKQQ